MGKTWIQTASGKQFDFYQHDPASISIVDIARALSNLCRFTGHCSFYSVAEHCFRVSLRCEELAGDQEHVLNSEEDYKARILKAARAGLLHDAAEAFIGDMNTPVKHLPYMNGYRDLEAVILGEIFQKFGVPLKDYGMIVHQADGELLATEKRDLKHPDPDWETEYEPLPHVRVACWSPDKAMHVFLKRFKELFPEYKE